MTEQNILFYKLFLSEKVFTNLLTDLLTDSLDFKGHFQYTDKDPKGSYPVNIYLLKDNNRNIRKRFEISSKLTIITTKQRQ